MASFPAAESETDALLPGIRRLSVVVRDALMTWAYASAEEREAEILINIGDEGDYFEHLSKYLDAIIIALSEGESPVRTNAREYIKRGDA